MKLPLTQTIGDWKFVFGSFLLLLFALLAACTPASSAARPAVVGTQDPTSMYRVMTFNVRLSAANDGANSWANRRELFLRTIKTANPDLLGCQEVLPNQRDFLKENLADYTYVGTGRDRNGAGEASPILVRKSRFTVVDSGQFWLSPTPEVPSKGWDAALNRICTWAQLKTTDGKTVFYFNTHMDHVGVNARAEGAKVIRQYVAAKLAAVPDAAILVTGDLNSFEDTSGYLNLVDGAGGKVVLLDAYRGIHPIASGDERTIHDFKGATDGRRIDYIFHTPQFVPVSAAIDRTHEGALYPSDHFPVVADLQLTR